MYICLFLFTVCFDLLFKRGKECKVNMELDGGQAGRIKEELGEGNRENTGYRESAEGSAAIIQVVRQSQNLKKGIWQSHSAEKRQLAAFDHLLVDPN